MARNEYVVGVDEAIRVLENLPNAIRTTTVKNSAKKALKPIAKEAKTTFLKNARNTNKKGISKVRYIARGIKTLAINSRKAPGARVAVKGPSINMGRKEWNLAGAAKLFSAGSYLTRNRRGKGYFKGFGNFIADAADRRRHITLLKFRNGLEGEMKKAVAKTMRRYGKR
ncbi:MAG: hypothetical protein ACRBG0_19335 [Lewinella sp.]|uniref:hypothetical protein n=1 Tax=Lewinella sp. TaxID=2004506 RepID=UPI003D6C5A27